MKEMISLDKAVRDVTGKTSYRVTLWCDNISAGKCTQMDGAQSFDDSVSEIQRKLRERETSGNKSQIADTHGDFVKRCVLENRVIVKWIESKENQADILTKPLSIHSTHTSENYYCELYLKDSESEKFSFICFRLPE